MVEDVPEDVGKLLGFLEDEFGAALRSCVSYAPRSHTIHYLRDDIDRTDAEDRLVSVAQLYQAERLNASLPGGGPEPARLYSSLHVFGGVVVVHLLNPGGRAVGFSVDAGTFADLVGLVARCLEAAYGDVPEPLA
jgi:hypothetical protein